MFICPAGHTSPKYFWFGISGVVRGGGGEGEVSRPAHLFFLNRVFLMMMYEGFEIQLYL